MPRIPQHILSCVAYLYQREDDARAGAAFGGTAFLVGVPTSVPGIIFVYAVSNQHVAMGAGASVLRINTRDGRAEIFPFAPHDWHTDGLHDIAVVSIDGISTERHDFWVIPVEMFATREDIEELDISEGEDLYMLGRFVDHDGGTVNRPSVRFGNISVMPSEIKQPGHLGKTDAYCIDLHSRSGYSGSPVFVYRLPMVDLVGQKPEKMRYTEGSLRLALLPELVHKLLGIHFAQFPENFDLDETGLSQVRTRTGNVPLLEGAQIKGLSGMTCVLPAWAILDVLNMPKLKDERDKENEALSARLEREDKVPRCLE